MSSILLNEEHVYFTLGSLYCNLQLKALLIKYVTEVNPDLSFIMRTYFINIQLFINHIIHSSDIIIPRSLERLMAQDSKKNSDASPRKQTFPRFLCLQAWKWANAANRGVKSHFRTQLDVLVSLYVPYFEDDNNTVLVVESGSIFNDKTNVRNWVYRKTHDTNTAWCC